MPSQAVQTPSPDQLLQYCLEHSVKLESLFELSWAIVLFLYYDTTVFVVNGAVDQSREDAAHPVLLNYVQDASKHSTVIDTLRSVSSEYRVEDSVLQYRDIEEGTSQLHKIWSQLVFVLSDAKQPNDVKGLIDGRSVRLLPLIWPQKS